VIAEERAPQRLITRAFVDPTVEAAYLDESAVRVRRASRILSLLALGIYTLIEIVELLDPSRPARWLGGLPNVQTLIVIRGAVSLPLLALVVASSWAPAGMFRKLWRLATCVCVAALTVVPAASWIFMPAPEGIDVGLASLSLLSALIAGCLVLPIGFVHALGVIGAFILAYVRLGSRVPAGAALFWVSFGAAMAAFSAWVVEANDRRAFLQRRTIARERARSEALLRNILPEPIAERLKADPSTIADRFASVTILFADIVGFTDLSARLEPAEIVVMLNRLFTAFDDLAEHHGLEKIKTIGDAYMVAAGLPAPREDHASAIADMALAMRDAVARVAGETGHPLAVRIGIHTGPVVAGVIGKRKFAYDLWGDAVNTASRMESHGLPGEIQLSEATRASLGARFTCEARGTISVKGKGDLPTWLLRGRA
jgi:class 3 adenylate cyclase